MNEHKLAEWVVSVQDKLGSGQSAITAGFDRCRAEFNLDPIIFAKLLFALRPKNILHIENCVNVLFASEPVIKQNILTALNKLKALK